MATKVLHLDASIPGAQLGQPFAVRGRRRKAQGSAPRLDRHLPRSRRQTLSHLTGAYFMASMSPQADHDASMREEIAVGKAVMDEFLAADIVVLGTGIYNFTLPSQVKAWVDRLAIKGKTFEYDSTGPVGLAGGKRVILAISRGGFYGPGTPTESFEHAESYMRKLFAFFGIPNIEVVAVEGASRGPEVRQAAIAQAQAAIAELAI